jgi:hypothetical protein
LNIFNFVSNKPNNFFNPKFSYYIGEEVLDINVDYLSKFLLSKEKDILNKYPFYGDGNTGLNKNSVTTRYIHYNLLNFKETGFLKKHIRDVHDKFLKRLKQKVEKNYYVQCWFNIMRKGEKIKKHFHAEDIESYLSGHLCVKTNNTNTYYEAPYYKTDYASENIPGKITLFPGWVTHHTDQQGENTERITIAFDILTEDLFDKTVKIHMKEHWTLI